MKIVKGGITAPQGFKANAVHSGLKKRNLDLALIYSEVPAVAAGLFTTNRIQAAPVKVSRLHLRKNFAQAILINSGNANSCTGERGKKCAIEIAGLAASRLGIDKSSLLLASTGIIGKALPVSKIAKAIPRLIKGLSPDGGSDVCKAIMTTDRAPKEIAVRFKLRGRSVTIGAVCKGAGMISPKLATMLAFFTTDINISKGTLARALKASIEESFNRITIDGDMSTNDTVIILANGLAQNPRVRLNAPGFQAFQDALDYVTIALAKLIVKGGEGVTKFIEVKVLGARTLQDAKMVAYNVANSPLVKTMVGGGDPNWGRVMASIGGSCARFQEKKVNLLFGNTLVLRDGDLVLKDASKLRRVLAKDEVRITIDLKVGRNKATVWTGDLTEEYVRINAKYSTRTQFSDARRAS